MNKIVIEYLIKKYKKKRVKIDLNTILLNKGLNLDSIEFVNLILFIEKKTKKKFSNDGYADLLDVKIKDFLKFFR